MGRKDANSGYTTPPAPHETIDINAHQHPPPPPFEPSIHEPPPPPPQPQAFPPPDHHHHRHESQALPSPPFEPFIHEPPPLPPQPQPQAFPPADHHHHRHKSQAFPPPPPPFEPFIHEPPPPPPSPSPQPQAFPPADHHHHRHESQAFPPPSQQEDEVHAFPPTQQGTTIFQHHHHNSSGFPAASVAGGGGVHGSSPNPQAAQGMMRSSSGFPVSEVYPTELWEAELFRCLDNPTNALVTLFFPCVTFGQIAEIVDSGQTSCAGNAMLYGCRIALGGLPCLMSCTYRTKLRRRYGLIEVPAPDWIVHFFCEMCALCQEYRELERRGLDPSIGWLGNMVKSGQHQMTQPNEAMTPPMQQNMRA